MPDSTEFLKGFTVQLEVAEVTSAGYLPVKIIVKSTARFAADRRFVFRFQTEPQLETPTRNGLIVNVPLVVSQGATSETFMRYLPKWSAGQAVSVIVMEDGRALDGYAAFFGGDSLNQPAAMPFQRISRSRRRLLNSEYEINWVFLSDEDQAIPERLPDLSGLLDRGERAWQGPTKLEGPLQRAGFWNRVMGGANLQAIGQQDLPSDWRAYQRFDVVVMDPKGLSRLRSNATARDAILDWVLNGGNVVVYNAASDTEVAQGFGVATTVNAKSVEVLKSIAYELSTRWQFDREQALMTIKDLEDSILQFQQQADRRTELPAETNAAPLIGDENVSTPAGSDTVMNSEMVMDEDFNSSELSMLGNDDPAAWTARIQDAEQQRDQQRVYLAELDRSLEKSVNEWSDQISVQGVGAGFLITLNPLEGHETPTAYHWEIVSRFLDHRASPTVRRGVDPLIGDRRFGNWTIPGVAQPPVYTFMGLLTLFVILVGPIAYRRTSKAGRSYLMFAIAPALALLTTVAMFSYGIISDGFGTVVRIRQLTWVDGQSGHAGERVRSTYFAGVRPSEGLQFAGDAELMIYREGTGQAWEDLDGLSPEMLGQVTVDEQLQSLDSSFLPSRQQCQFVVHEPRRDVGFLQLIPDPKGVLSPEVTSGFGFPLRQVVVKDDQANYWLVENLGANSVQRSKPLTTREASTLLGKLYTDHRPIAGVRETRATTNRYDNKIYDVIVDINRIMESKLMVTDGLFELWLQQNLQTSTDIPNQHFVAITDVSQDVIAVEGCEVNSSIRYVFGTLR